MSKLSKEINSSKEQEYAHKYPIDNQQNYQYPNEDKRIPLQNETSIDDNYNVQTENVSQKRENKLRVRLNLENITNEHKENVYKVRINKPIFTGTNVGTENMQNQNNAREDEIKKINESSQLFEQKIELENSLDLTTPKGRIETTHIDCCFEIGDKVSHIEEDIKGEVKFVGKNTLSVVWEDNTRERFDITIASKSLKKLSYVDTTQQQVAPLDTTPFPKNDEKISPAVEKALKALSEDDTEDDIIESGIDIEKLKLKRKIGELEHKVESENIEKIKTKAAKEFIELMKAKKMINSEEEEKIQFENIMKMDDEGFEAFKLAILSSKESTDYDDVLSVLEDDDFSDIEDGREYAMAREAMKKINTAKRSLDGIEMGDTSFFENGGLKNFKPVIGDFSSSNSSSEYSETRSLSAAANGRKSIERKASNLDLSSFEGIQGIKTPINIPSKEMTRSSTFSELFNSLNWTTTSMRK